MVWSEAHSSHRLRACATVNSAVGAPRGMSAHQGQTPKNIYLSDLLLSGVQTL